MTRLVHVVWLVLALAGAGAACRAAPPGKVPRYDHIVVIVEENKDYAQILDPAVAPNIARLAITYGDASRFYGEVHPSEGNYVALVGGDTFGIRDDDWALCKPGPVTPECPFAATPGYVDHTTRQPHLGDQLAAVGLTWKGYYENLPAPGSLAFLATDPALGPLTRGTALYAAKHTGFVNFASVQNDPRRARRLVGFDVLAADLALGHLPNFALIVPNQCNEMHGLYGARIPADCQISNTAGLIGRGDAYIGTLIAQLQATPAWKSRRNMAIVITFDEGEGGTREGCCAVTPDAPSNFGGGHIPTIVITNHGPRGIRDATPYNHYSLLRTIEDAFGLKTHLAHAADTDKGVVSMTPLFAVGASGR